MPAIVAKLQRCGKTNCRCFTTGELHGPYFWIVSYRRKKDRNGRGKYEWKYLGKAMKVVLEKLAKEVPDFFENFGERKISQAILRAYTNTKADFDKSSSVNTQVRPVLGDLSRLKEAKRKKTSPLVEV
ncbi:MAG: DUF6788 family protein [Candidatus Hodarchaeales archaeon]